MLQLGSNLRTPLTQSALCALPRMLHTSKPSLRPDLYEGDRPDRNPYPSPYESLTMEGSSSEQDKDLPPGTYPIQGDPSCQDCHPSKEEALATKTRMEDAEKYGPPPRDDEYLTNDTKATASKGDPNAKVD